jgi:hypothetical protein
VSSVGLAVALLTRAVDAGTQAQAACSTADEHARTMLDVYTQIADDSGRDAPNAAGRDVSDAQDALLQVTNNLHHAAEALGDYVRQIAPALTGGFVTGSSYRPSGRALVETPSGTRLPRTRRAARVLVGRMDDVSDAVQKNTDNIQGAVAGFRKLPDEPGASGAVTRQPTPDAPTARAPDTNISAGGVLDSVVVVTAVVVAGKEFVRRMIRMFKARPGDGTS